MYNCKLLTLIWVGGEGGRDLPPLSSSFSLNNSVTKHDKRNKITLKNFDDDVILVN